MRAAVYNNLLMIRGGSAERDTLLQVAVMFDVDWMKGSPPAFSRSRTRRPTKSSKELDQVFQANREGKGLVRFQPIKRVNGILALTQKPAILKEVETLGEPARSRRRAGGRFLRLSRRERARERSRRACSLNRSAAAGGSAGRGAGRK